MEDFGKTSTSKEACLLCPWGTGNLCTGLAARVTRTEQCLAIGQEEEGKEKGKASKVLILVI